jgi:nitroimidazol reductase NimA-like FMN-containing flavoprotein (pyridoxamine 5'-phosphate oxidase superfamily)
MRRTELEITDSKVLKKILSQAKYVTLALAMDNQPYLVSLSHGYDESRNCIYFHCAKEGKKIDFIKSNNVVWGQALFDASYREAECDHFFASVHFRGKITLLEHMKDKRQAAECMIRRLNKNPNPMLADTKPEKLEKTLFGRIDIDYMSGKKHGKFNL